MATLAADLKHIAKGTHGDPFKALGHMKNDEGKGIVRAWLPEAEAAWIVDSKKLRPMAELKRKGFFEAPYPLARKGKPYRLKVTYKDGTEGAAGYYAYDVNQSGLALGLGFWF